MRYNSKRCIIQKQTQCKTSFFRSELHNYICAAKLTADVTDNLCFQALSQNLVAPTFCSVNAALHVHVDFTFGIYFQVSSASEL